MKNDYIHVTGLEPHVGRRQEILKKHPDVKNLFGPYFPTFLITLFVIASQCAMAFLLRDKAWYWMLLAAYTVGAILNHALFVVIHEATHNLIFRTTKANKWAGIIAGMPQIFPSAIAFRKFHLLHHKHQGEMAYDADLAGPREAAIVGNSTVMKTLWLLGFLLVEGVVRPRRLKNIKWFDKWVVANLFVQIVFAAAVVYFTGLMGFLYLTLSTVFGIGLHPVGARWIQEHYVFKKGQETYSYYGPYNIVSLNVGYHNEHHDFMNVAWVNLPKLKAKAPTFYNNLMYHTSYTKLLFRFLFDKKITLKHRQVRKSKEVAPNQNDNTMSASDVLKAS